MEQYTIMRRANGELFTLIEKGQEYLALWPTLASAVRHKKRNPQLRDYLTALVSSKFAQQKLAPLQKEGMGLYLLNDTNDVYFGNGNKISWQDLAKNFSETSWISAYQPERILTRFGQETSNATDESAVDSLNSLERLADDGGNPQPE